MKKLILLQGASGTGKSSWVRDHHLTDCTISADEIRQRLGLTIHAKNGNMPIIKIKDHNDSITWEIFNKIIDYRMAQGALTIVDNTNTTTIALNQMHNLANKYSYHVYLLDFMYNYLKPIMQTSANPATPISNATVQSLQKILLERNTHRILYPVPKYVLLNQIRQYLDFRRDITQNPDKYNWLEWLDQVDLTSNDVSQLIDN